MLVDDHPLLRAGFMLALRDYQEISVVAEAADPETALQLYNQLHPKVVVMDVRFGDKHNGLAATQDIIQLDAQANVVVMTQHDQDQIIKEAYRLGAKAFINKNQNPDVLATVIREVASGELFFLPEIAQRLATMAAKQERSPAELLNKREYEVFRGIAGGNTSSEIAQNLQVSLKTVSNASHSLKQKLGLHRTADLTRHAIRYGVIQLDS